jgi:4-amino-4-deoxy-L-arabinose transferase-like glycosyltransferase
VAGRRAAAVVVLVLAAAVVFALPVGRRPLFNQDEVRYAMLAREVVDHARWILPHVRGEVYLNKPPLFFWAVALVSLPAGAVTDTTAPLVSVVSALAGLLGVLAIGRRLWGFSSGFAAALILATTPFYFFMAHQVLTDMMLTAWLTWALYFYLRITTAGGGVGAWLGFYLCVAGALGSKGPVALLGLLAAVVATLATDGRAGLRALRLPAGIGLIALTTLPWLLPYIFQTEKSYARSVLVTDYLAWYFRSGGDSRLIGLGNYLGGFLPWTLFLIPAIWWWRVAPDRGRRRLLAWGAVFVAAIAISGSQRSRYFLPVLPVLALLVAEFLVRAPVAVTASPGAQVGARGRRALAVVVAVLAVGAVVGAAILLLLPELTGLGHNLIYVPAPGLERWLVAVLALTGAGAALVAALRGAGGLAVTVRLAAALLAVLALEAATYPARYAHWYDVRSFVERVRKERPAGSVVLAHPDASLAFDFYLRGAVREMPKTADVQALVGRQSPKGVLLIREERWTALQAGADPSWREMASGTVAGRRMLLVGNGQ